MTKDIISLAKQAGFQFRDAGYSPVLHLVPLEYSQKCFERFATLLRSKDSESFGSIVKYRNSFDFSPWPGVLYLNNAPQTRSAEPVSLKREPLCRDCADFGPICPIDGKPRDPDANHQHIQPTCR